MLTKKFTFFCVMLGFDLIGSVSGLGDLPIAGLPLIVLVSGWKYAGYFVLVTELLALPFWGQRIMALQSILPSIWHIAKLKPEELKGLVSQYIPANPIISPSNPANPLFLILIVVSLLAFITFSLYGSYKSLRMYITMLRRARQIARTWHH